MQQIDTNKIKTMTSDRIAYTLYERNRIMKKKKLKKEHRLIGSNQS